MTSPVAYWQVSDLEAKLAEVTAAGATVKDSRATSAAAAGWPPSPTPMATSSGCSRTHEASKAEPLTHGLLDARRVSGRGRRVGRSSAP